MKIETCDLCLAACCLTLTASIARACADKHPAYPTVLGRPEHKPKAQARTVYDEARGRAPPRPQEPKDYAKLNIQNAVRQVPRQPPARTVDTRRGSALLLETSGLEPKYIFRKVEYRLRQINKLQS